MHAVMLIAPREVVAVDLARPQPGADDVVIEVAAAGVCASDLHAYRGVHPFRKPPVVLGHEVAGRIIAVGADVVGLAIGDRVAVEPHRGCGQCSLCLSGHYHLCRRKEVPGKGPWLGSFAEYFRAPAAVTYRLPASVSWAAGALVEPLAVGEHAVRVADVKPGERAVVLGVGAIGLGVLLALSRAGAAQTAAVDVVRGKLDLAQGLGAVAVEAAALAGGGVSAALGGEADVIFVTANYPTVLRDALQCSAPLGRVVVLSLFDEPAEIDTGVLVFGERRIIGSLTYLREDFQTVIAELARDSSRAETIISHTMPLVRADEAMRMLDRGTDGAVKIILSPGLG